MTNMNARRLSIALAVALWAAPAFAESMIGDPEAGLAFARQVCSGCHVVEEGQTGRMLIQSLSFADIAAHPKMTETAIRWFLQTPHVAMPNYILTQDQTDHVVAYILSLTPPATE